MPGDVGSAAVLIVDSALHGHIELPLTAALLIGSDIAADMVLADPGMAKSHLKVSYADGLASVVAIDGVLQFRDGSALAVGESRHFDTSCDFHAGSVALQLQLPQAAQASAPMTVSAPTPRRLPYLVPGCVALLGAIVLGSTAVAFAGMALPLPSAAVAPPAVVAPAKSDAARVRDALLLELARRGLATITVQTLPEGSNRAAGVLAPAQKSGWIEAKQWADGAFPGVLLVDAVTIAPKGPGLTIQSAWTGPNPYVIDGAGEKLLVGAKLPDGWIIEAIEAGRVNLINQNQRLVVRF